MTKRLEPKLLLFFLGGVWLAGCGPEETRAEWGPDVHYNLDTDRILRDVAYLASDALLGREPGKAGNQLASDHLEALFDELGLQPAGDPPGYRQAFDFVSWDLNGIPDLRIGNLSQVAGKDYRVVRYSGSGQVDAEVVFAGYGLSVPPFDPGSYPDCPLDPVQGFDEYAGLDVVGKVVLVLRHGPGDEEAILDGCPGDGDCRGSSCLWTFSYKTVNAVDHRARAVLFVQDYRHEGSEIPVVTLDARSTDENTPVLFVDRSRIEAILPDLMSRAALIDSSLVPASGATAVQAMVSVQAQRTGVKVANVLGAVHGTDQALGEQVVVVGAHLDHLGTDPLTGEIYHGADDNASGTAVLMELARLLMSMRSPPARTVLLAAWNVEEAGLVGSCHYVQRPTFPVSSTLAALSIDMVGAGDGTAVVLFGGSEPINQWLAEVMRGSADRNRIDGYIYPFVPVYQSDHACFAKAGVPALLVSTFGPHGTYHTLQDTIETISKEDLGVAASLIWALLEPLAQGTERTYLQ